MRPHSENFREIIYVTGGFGPIQAISSPLNLEISPLTVFIGPQGTGKSLVSQLLYFFHDAEYLLSNHFNQQGIDATVRKVVEGIRVGALTNRALASFLTTNRVHINYELNYQQNSQILNTEYKISLYKSNRKINPVGQFRKEIDKWLNRLLDDPSISGKIYANALFIPAERTFFSRFINADPTIIGSNSLPLTMREFAKVLNKTAETHIAWDNRLHHKPQEANEIDNLVRSALGGSATSAKKGPYARKWQWLPEKSNQPLEIEMASSGQMGTWPLVSTAQALFSLPESQRPLFIHIEEPETHLHPAAQVAVVKVLAYLVNHGFRLVITTHSLVVLYMLNNLTLAYRNLPDKSIKNMPDTQARLNPKSLSAYLFAEGTVQSIIDDSGQIDDGLLGNVLGELEVEFSQLQSYGIFWE
ncbi:MAG: ATP-binding protein [Symploca sp. SIO2G7]|nr:ATP-binding protein [Symploca sp. SIO2G7]